jgi:hypothetical protein
VCRFELIKPSLVGEGRIPCSTGAGGVGSIPANSDAQNVPSFRRWRFELKLSPFFLNFFFPRTAVFVLFLLIFNSYAPGQSVKPRHPTYGGVYNNNPKKVKTQAKEEVDNLKELGLRVCSPLLPSAENLSKLAWGTGSTEIYQEQNHGPQPAGENDSERFDYRLLYIGPSASPRLKFFEEQTKNKYRRSNE